MPSPVAANSRSQLSRILSNTGWVSATELLMTCRTAAVAVCCSSASLVSLKSRAFWIAITAWSAKVRSSRCSLSSNARSSGRPTRIEPIALPSQSIGATATEYVSPSCPAIRRSPSGTSGSFSTSEYVTRRRSRIACSLAVPASGTGKMRRVRSIRSASGPRIAPSTSRSCSSTRKTISWLPANRRSQPARILSNTGAVSATELLIACSTSEVAICCSSASLVSLNRRTFSIAITAWSANVCSSST